MSDEPKVIKSVSIKVRVFRTRIEAGLPASSRPVTLEAKPAGTADEEALRWLREEIVPEYDKRGEKPRIDDLEPLALRRFPSLTGRAFYLKVWTPGAPAAWKRGGRPKGSPRAQKARRR